MEKRAYQRIPAGEKIKIIHGNTFYSGTILNLSEKGMFIGTKVLFPLYSIIRIESKSFNLCAKVNRLTEMNEYHEGVGVELFNLSQEYLEYMSSLKAPL